MSAFEIFGQLVVDLWSSSEHQHLTNHHVESVAAAEDQLRETIEEVAAYDPPPDRRPDAQDFAFHLMKMHVTGMGGGLPGAQVLLGRPRFGRFRTRELAGRLG